MNLSRRTNHCLRLVVAGLVLTLTAALTSTPAANATYPGRVGRIAVGVVDAAGNGDIYSVRPDGRDQRRLTDSPGTDLCPAYDATGQRIAFCSNRTGAFEIWQMRADGSRERQVTDLGGFATFPDFAPWGHRIAFTFAERDGVPADIWTVRDDGTRARNLTRTASAEEAFPVYSPAGLRIAFVRFEDFSDTFNGQLWIMDRDGRHQRQLTFDAVPKDQLPDWSPDGRKIAYQGGLDIWVMNADGSGQRNITNSPDVTELGPAWSPDGRRIAFLNLEEQLIYTMRADGTDVQLLSGELVGRHRVPAWQPLRRHK